MEQNRSLQQHTTAALSENSRDKVKYEADLMAIVIYLKLFCKVLDVQNRSSREKNDLNTAN